MKTLGTRNAVRIAFSILLAAFTLFKPPMAGGRILTQQQVYGPAFLLSLEETQTLHEKAETLFWEGQYTKAFVTLFNALEVTKERLGAGNRDMPILLRTKAIGLGVLGDLDEAIQVLNKAQEASIAIFGTNHPVTATILLNQSRLKLGFGRLDEAKALLDQCMFTQERYYGTNHMAYAISLQTRSDIGLESGRFSEAIATLSESAVIIDNHIGKDNVYYANGLACLSKIYSVSGNHQMGIRACEACLSILDRTISPKHITVALAWARLALAHQQLDNYASAYPCFIRAIEIVEKTLGPESLPMALLNCQLGVLLYQMGSYSEALAYYNRSNKIYESKMGKESPLLGNIINCIGLVYLRQNDYDKANYYFRRSTAMLERIYGAQSVQITPMLNNMALVEEATGHINEALHILERCFTIQTNAWGPRHPSVATTYNNIAHFRAKVGDYAGAILSYSNCLSIYVNYYGWEHSKVIATLSNQAIDAFYLNDYDLSFKSLAYLNRCRRRVLCKQLPGMNDYDSARIAEGSFGDSDLIQSFCFSQEGRDTPAATELGAQSLSMRKGLLEEIRTTVCSLEFNADTTTKQLKTTFLEIRSSIDGLEDIKMDEKARFQRRGELSKRLAQISSELQNRVSRWADLLTETEVPQYIIAKYIPENACLLDFIKYRRFDFRLREWKERRYAVYLTFPLDKSKTNVVVQSIDLGEAAYIDDCVKELRKTMLSGRISPKRLMPILKLLSDTVYSPLSKQLTNVSHLIICPDGSLNLVPFEALLYDEHYLVERNTISYVSSGREVVRLSKPVEKRTGNASLVMGNPDFDVDLSKLDRSSSIPNTSQVPSSLAASGFLVKALFDLPEPSKYLSRSVRGLRFTSLPNAAAEARSVAILAGTNSILRLGAQAREATLKSVVSPTMLHLATHGFFRPDQEIEPTSSLSDEFLGAGQLPYRRTENVWENPMVRCGIALAGANHALQTTNSAIEDGLLTGLEASLLNLQGTELVILSACDTGTGEIKIGEGVMSLRRAFRIAGAQSVLASHWPVSDKATSRLMTDFMRRWRAGEPRAQAWRQAQLSLLRSQDFSSPYFWGAFTLTGQWR